jgi:hypothetical protein
LFLFLAALTLALTPAAAGAKTPPPKLPQLDTATATGSADGSTNIDVDVHSGPSGENPGGTVSYRITPVPGATFHFFGPATCLNATGNTAVIAFDATATIGGGTIHFGRTIVELVDNGGSGLDGFGASGPLGGSLTECSQGVPTSPLNGRAVVFDAQPFPPGKRAATERPFKGRTSGTFPPSQPGIVEGTFQATHIGKGTYFSDNVSVTQNGAALSYSGDLVITAANGDKLFTSGTGSGTLGPGCSGPGECVATVTVTDTITGGTGRFEEASGSYVSEVRGVADSVGGYVTTSRIDGTIGY